MHQSAYSAHSNMHSSRWSAPPPDAEESETESEGPWAPPAWQNHNNKWYRKSYLQESSPLKSRTATPYEQSVEREVTPSRIPLPESPRKMTPRTSPEPVDARHLSPDTIASRLQSPSVEPEAVAGAQQSLEEEEGPLKRDGCTSRPLFPAPSSAHLLTARSHPSRLQIREPCQHGAAGRAPLYCRAARVQGKAC